jgi:hypothetical protein
MTTTDLDVSLFAGATPADMVAAATDVATQFSDIVKQQRMYKRIGDRDHILIEAWQTVGSLVGVFAVKDQGVTELPWPTLGTDPGEVLLEASDRGLAYGFAASFKAVKDGREIGWGEGRCDRSEKNWAGRDNYALASMAQTRAQSRALGAPLRFIVKLAGYEGTAAEELDGTGTGPAADTPPAPPWGPVADDNQENQAANLVRAIAGDTPVQGEQFILAMGQHFQGVPVACVTMLRGLARFIGDARSAQPAPENAPPAEETSAYHNQPDPADVYPQGDGPRYHGD